MRDAGDDLGRGEDSLEISEGEEVSQGCCKEEGKEVEERDGEREGRKRERRRGSAILRLTLPAIKTLYIIHGRICLAKTIRKATSIITVLVFSHGGARGGGGGER